MNPIRNEADAFRVVVVIGAGALAVIAAAALISSLVGALLGLGLLAYAGWRLWQGHRATRGLRAEAKAQRAAERAEIERAAIEAADRAGR